LGAESSQVTSPTPGGFQIDGGATRGTNLFHSFSEFSIPTNGNAFFNNALTIENIITRVTGASGSNIDGAIIANGTANLFLINPNGIVFGVGASLNIGGSFLASTARGVVFDNGFEFSATNPQSPPLLTINVPLGLQTGANPGSIVNQSRANGNGLQVEPGKTLALVGGEVALEGGILSARDGRIELGSVAGNSRMSLTPTLTGYALGYDGVENFQDIRLSQEARVITSADSGGSIQVQGRNVTLTEGSQILANTFGSGKGGGLSVNASDSVQVIGRSADGEFGSALAAQASRTATGEAGDLTITTGQLLIRDGAQVGASTFGAGKGGNLTVNASESVQVIGTSNDGEFSSFLGTPAYRTSKWDAGDMSITTARLLIKDGAYVSASTFGAGKGGNLTVNASESVQVIGESTDGEFSSSLGTPANRNSTGDAGDLSITTARLLITDGAQVSASTFGAGKGGNLTVNASEEVQVIGRSADGELASFLGTPANRNSTGDAGDLSITTARLLITDGAFVSASTNGAGKGGNLTVNASEEVQVIGTSADSFFPGFLGTPAYPNSKGDAGDMSITTARLLIKDGGYVSASTFSLGRAANLTVNASESVQVIGTSPDGEFSSSLEAQSNPNSTGDAGDLSITTPELLIKDGAQVSASTFSDGKGGNLTVNASSSVQVIGTSKDGRFPSGLFVNATDGSTAGNLTVETGQMSVRDGAQVSVSSPTGQAGNMTITAEDLTLNRGRLFAETGKSTAEGGANITLQGLDLLRMDNESLISANALEDANGGNVTIASTFIVATPPKGPEGSDITANAVRGNGGRVSLATQGLFGIEFRPKLTPKNDITASSEFGIAGEVAINTPDVDPSRGLTNLPTEPVDASNQIAQICPTGEKANQNQFIITGRGGLPEAPDQMLSTDTVWTDLRPTPQTAATRSIPQPAKQPPNSKAVPLVEATGWVMNDKGKVVLTASAPTITPQHPALTPPTCPRESVK
jgi:filamentous hemagglutinin family protein